MKFSKDRILTTHVGSLARPQTLLAMLLAQSRGEAVDQAVLTGEIDAAVNDTVKKQVESGIDIVNDGEMSKTAYTFYVLRALGGLELAKAGAGAGAESIDNKLFPDYAEMQARGGRNLGQVLDFPTCTGPVSYKNLKPLEEDLARLKAAAKAAGALDVFVPTASPGVLVRFVRNAYYKTEDDYLEALGTAMQVEYEAIHKAGFVLQLDCPDLGSSRNNIYKDLSEAEFLKIAHRHVEVLNHATRNIPGDAMRLHLCWGNYEGPHTHDIELAKIAPVAFASRAQAISFDGRERVIAGADCGFATFAARPATVAPSIVWAKFKSMAEGAAIASKRLWS
ncbi:MAG: 5-methyltetrahydropteroyltriglutamate/homocysteine S-methyltransferase [Rhodospirillales bacterium]|nr:5-methyltetrahydropteroyltriglutamate/homocysteine S-methyltransferase [Rhodospirillales bacterium]